MLKADGECCQRLEALVGETEREEGGGVPLAGLSVVPPGPKLRRRQQLLSSEPG